MFSMLKVKTEQRGSAQAKSYNTYLKCHNPKRKRVRGSEDLKQGHTNAIWIIRTENREKKPDLPSRLSTLPLSSFEVGENIP